MTNKTDKSLCAGSYNQKNEKLLHFEAKALLITHYHKQTLKVYAEFILNLFAKATF